MSEGFRDTCEAGQGCRTSPHGAWKSLPPGPDDLTRCVHPCQRPVSGPFREMSEPPHLMKRSNSPQGRIVIGKIGRHLVAAKPRESVVVCGPPGSGKTCAFAIPNLLEWDGPAVVCSVTSEILSTTLPVRSSHGRMAWVYDPAGSVEGVIRIGWNPVPACVDFQKATRLAHHLVSLSTRQASTRVANSADQHS